MKKYSPFTRVRILIYLAILFAFAAHGASAQSQNRTEKPQAILFDSYSEGSYRVYQTPAPTAPRTRQRIVAAGYNNAFETSATPKTAFGLRATAAERQAFDLVNDERRRAGLTPLQMDSEMLYLARTHSDNMARHDFFSHTGRDGLSVDGRARKAGVRWQSIGENIAYSQNARSPVPFAVRLWMNSAGHRRNILSQNWTRAGIGIATAPDGKFYITQVFAR